MTFKSCIMAIDDEPIILRTLERALVAKDYQVITVSDSSKAIPQLEKFRPDLILLDIMMPGLDGFQILNLIRERCNAPVIMLTAKDQCDSKVSTLIIGADDYITKPFSIDVLVARIESKLRRTKDQVKWKIPQEG